MFGFFRKYQKIFLGLFTALIVMSFFFYGTASTFSGRGGGKKEISTPLSIHGVKVEGAKLANYALLLTLGSSPNHIGNKELPWLLVDDFFLDEFIQSGLIEKIVQAHEKLLQKDFEDRLNYIKRCELFTHPQIPEISLERIWAYFAPELLMAWRQLKSLEDPTTSQVAAALANFYAKERSFPMHQARQMIASLLAKYSPEQANYFLAKVDINPLGFETIHDFFGEKTVNLAVGYFLEIAQKAKAEGFKVTKRDIKKQMLFSAKNQMQQLKAKGINVELSKSQYEGEILRQLTAYNLSKAEAKQYIADLIRVKNLLEKQKDVTDQTLDPATFIKWQLKKTTLDKGLFIKSYTDFLAVQCYLEAVYKDYKANSLALPQQVRSIEEILQNYPEMIIQGYSINYRALDKNQRAARIPLRDIIEYQMSDEGWKILVKADLELIKAVTLKERMALFDKMSPQQRQKLDRLAASALLEAHPEKGSQMILLEPWQTIEISLLGDKSIKGFAPLIKDAKRFAQSIEKGDAFGLEEDGLIVEVKDIKALNDAQILGFEQAKKQGTLETLVKKKLAKWEITQLDEAKLAQVCKKVYSALFLELADFSLANFDKKISDPDYLIALRFVPLLTNLETIPLLSKTGAQTEEYFWQEKIGSNTNFSAVGQKELIFDEQEGVFVLEVLGKELDEEGFVQAKKVLEQDNLNRQKTALLEIYIQEIEAAKSVEYKYES